MSWVTVIWSMVGASCLTLALVHGMIWWQRREARANLLFALFAVATALQAAGEMWIMRTGTPEEYGTAMRWTHVSAWMMVIFVVGFVRLYQRAGRPWLAWTVFGMRTLSLLLNFTTGVNLNYREITAVRSISFLGEPVSVADGVANPWMLVGQLSLLLLVIFITDAALTVWRRGNRRQSLVLGGGIVFLTLMSGLQSVLVFWHAIPMPITASLFCLGVVVAMGFELSQDMLRAAGLSEELRESEQQMILAADAANLGIWVRDLDRKTIWATDKWRALFGFGKSTQLELGAILKRVHPDDREVMRQALTSAIEAEGSYEQDYRLLLPDGKVRWIASRGRAEFNSSGKPHLVRGVSLDITERKRVEAEAQQHRNEVTHLSRVAMLGELSGSLAHELNQPLTAILSNAQAAQRFLARPELDRAELEEILHDIVESDRHAGEVIRGLRLLLKKGEVRHQPLDANEVILEVLKLMRSDLLNHHISVETDLAKDLPEITGDRVQLQQVLLNLVMNASDAMAGNEESSRRLRVSMIRTPDDFLQISVRDNGRGIPPDKLNQVFESYYTTKPQGLGLGLAVCRSILAAHHGRLSAENHPDGGAVFHFCLPLAPANRHSSPESAPPR
ncbi:MAG: ATP-binding protein [Verrucomicrobiota bacterium]